ncbi:MAG: peptide-methionine (S)-S-oxide reductase MsrA [Erythrobacter sp.]|uniref:peptide-methionine (S)-S-oxide reductase MsrA n=1 Tax=Erythrobacter sp. TaxID=1042 RepID=UPI003267537C
MAILDKFLTRFPVWAALSILTISCASPSVDASQTEVNGDTIAEQALANGHATAVFAMGCFWCAEADFEKLDGVVAVVSGYTGGELKDPTYRQVTHGDTGHYEAVLVTYDESKLSYDDLLATFWTNIDPFDANGQFCDKGTSYRAAIFPRSDSETEAANKSKEQRNEELQEEPVTAILPRATFYKAEEYHQDYYKKNPIRYGIYRSRCGRDARLADIWGSSSK